MASSSTDASHRQPERLELAKVFRRFDADNNGTLGAHELANALKFMGLAVDAAMCNTLLDLVDADNSGELDFEEFDVLHEQAKLRVAFAEMDADGSGSIATTELKAAMQSLGYKLGDAEVASMLRSVDTDNDGTVSFPEFHSFFKSLGPDAGLYVVWRGHRRGARERWGRVNT